MQVFESSCILILTHVANLNTKEFENGKPCPQFVDTLRLKI